MNTHHPINPNDHKDDAGGATRNFHHAGESWTTRGGGTTIHFNIEDETFFFDAFVRGVSGDEGERW